MFIWKFLVDSMVYMFFGLPMMPFIKRLFCKKKYWIKSPKTTESSRNLEIYQKIRSRLHANFSLHTSRLQCLPRSNKFLRNMNAHVTPFIIEINQRPQTLFFEKRHLIGKWHFSFLGVTDKTFQLTRDLFYEVCNCWRQAHKS